MSQGVGVAIMGHKRRADQVISLNKDFNHRAVEVWDTMNDRWDTGRRALLAAAEQGESWSLVVQDDAILCKDFLEGVNAALNACPRGPASFYTGKTRPYAAQVERAVHNAKELGRSFVAMRGPLWGVAIAIPTEQVEDVVRWGDRNPQIQNYDIRISEYYANNTDLLCHYTIPSLVDHRIGPLNPSLVPGRRAGAARVAHSFIGSDSPCDIDWHTGVYASGDPSEPWKTTPEGTLQCTACKSDLPETSKAIQHCTKEHGLGPFDFLVSNREDLPSVEHVVGQIDSSMRGRVFLAGEHLLEYISLPSYVFHAFPRKRVEKELSQPSLRFVICGGRRDLQMIGPRAGWSLDGWSN